MPTSSKFLLLSFIWLSALCGADSFVTPEQALQKLIDGNARFVKHTPKAVFDQQNMRDSTIESQAPFAVILGCSDSRVPPEVIFDQSIGRLFVVRVAGNVSGATEVESVDYGVAHLNAPLVVVLGHQSCGAVDAVVSGQDSTIPEIAKIIAPAVQESLSQQGDRLVNAIKDNAVNVANNLLKDPTLKAKVAEGKLKVVPAYYDFNSGKVIILKN